MWTMRSLVLARELILIMLKSLAKTRFKWVHIIRIFSKTFPLKRSLISRLNSPSYAKVPSVTQKTMLCPQRLAKLPKRAHYDINLSLYGIRLAQDRSWLRVVRNHKWQEWPPSTPNLTRLWKNLRKAPFSSKWRRLNHLGSWGHPLRETRGRHRQQTISLLLTSWTTKK